jgi:thioredoxin 1
VRRETAKIRRLVLLCAASILCCVVAGHAQQDAGPSGGVLTGTVKAVDAVKGIIGVAQPDGQQTFVAVTAATIITRQETAAASDVQVGQMVVVMGQPTTITARTISISPLPAPAGAASPGAAAEATPTADEKPASTEAPASSPQAVAGPAAVTGQVTQLSPLTVRTGDGVVVVVNLADDAQVSKPIAVTLDEIKPGDAVTVTGKAGTDGYLYAKSVQIRAGEAQADAPTSLTWVGTMDAALSQANATGQPVMIDFYTGWCSWCKTLDEKTYSDPGVISALAGKVVTAKIDAEAQAAEARKYQVSGYPTIVFLNSTGAEIHRIEGYVPPDAFLSELKTALQKTK